MFGPREQLCTSSTSLRPYDEILRLLNLSSGYYVVEGEPLMESYGRRARAYIVPSEHDIRTRKAARRRDAAEADVLEEIVRRKARKLG